MINYEAWDGEEQIYNGTSILRLIHELHEYIKNQNHLSEVPITKAEIDILDEKALKNIGIELYFAKW